MSEVQRFWCHEAQNIFCVRAADYDALAAQRDEGLAREAELRGEIERLKGLPHGQILAEAAAKHLLDSGAENFVGEVFTIDADDGQTQFEIVVTTQRVGAKSPGEICNELQQRLAKAEKPQPLFVATVLRKLRRFVECMEDGQGADIGRHWFDVLTRLGLLNRVQRSPALWELTDEAEQFLSSPGSADGEKAE